MRSQFDANVPAQPHTTGIGCAVFFCGLSFMQIRRIHILGYVFLVGIYIAIVSGCGSSVNISGNQTDVELFEQGKRYYEQGEYKKSLQYFLYVKDHFLRSSYAGITRFYAGESYFELEKYEDAVIEYKSFLSFFPTDPLAAAAQYKLGVSYLKQSLGPDRDQTMIHKALTELQNVRKNYPDNEEDVRKAEEQIQRTKNTMALHEFLVAEFYRKEKLYTSSNQRLIYLMKEYPESALNGDALFMLGINYLDLKQPEDAKAPFLRLLQYYPEHQDASQARKKLAKLGVTDIPEPVAQTRLVQNADTHSPEKTPSEPTKPQPPSSLRGYIVLKRDNIVFTDLIRDDGIREGAILEVYRKDELIGTIRIIEIQGGFSIGEIESLTSNMTIQEEDRVLLSPNTK